MIRSGWVRIVSQALLLCAFVECTSFAVLVGKDALRTHGLRSAIIGRLAQHPLAPKTTVLFGPFDPVIGQRNTPYAKLGNVVVNKNGFISNGETDPAIDNFPDKSAGVFRILLLGSSVIAGNALRSDASHTISADLERLLNTRAPRGRRFEVLNFGFSGSHSYSELRFLAGQGVYIKPDLVISLDGWLDAVESAFGAERNGLGHGIINWGQISYLENDLFMGTTTVRSSPPYVFTYLYLLLEEGGFFPRPKDVGRQAQYDAIPWYRQSGRLMTEQGGFQFVLPTNLAMMAAICQANGIAFIDYLEPYADYLRKANAEEQQALADYHAALVSAGQTYWDRSSYAAAMERYYASYAAAFEVLQQKYADDPRIRFFNITDIFKSNDARVYLDASHFNEEGNRLLAERFAADVEELLVTTSPR